MKAAERQALQTHSLAGRAKSVVKEYLKRTSGRESMVEEMQSFRIVKPIPENFFEQLETRTSLLEQVSTSLFVRYIGHKAVYLVVVLSICSVMPWTLGRARIDKLLNFWMKVDNASHCSKKVAPAKTTDISLAGLILAKIRARQLPTSD
jgi:hypothetical protein